VGEAVNSISSPTPNPSLAASALGALQRLFFWTEISFFTHQPLKSHHPNLHLVRAGTEEDIVVVQLLRYVSLPHHCSSCHVPVPVPGRGRERIADLPLWVARPPPTCWVDTHRRASRDPLLSSTSSSCMRYKSPSSVVEAFSRCCRGVEVLRHCGKLFLTVSILRRRECSPGAIIYLQFQTSPVLSELLRQPSVPSKSLFYLSGRPMSR
jgi:hypothetical protein